MRQITGTNLKLINRKLLFFVFFVIPSTLFSQVLENKIPALENPVSVEYLRNNLPKYHPRLGLTPQLIKKLRYEVENDEVVANVFEAFKLNANKILQQPLLERKLEGRRLLSVSRDMLYRMSILAMIYAIEQDDEILQRINDEIIQVCNFRDWNPTHFLDVAEMSLAVAIGIDWTGEDLPVSTTRLAKDALMEKGIRPSYQDIPGSVSWIKASNNWNQVCHAGMIAAALATAEDEPELAVQTIRRALDYMPNALKSYMPDGVYPEGPSYWSYGTRFTLITQSILQSAFDTDFGLSTFPGLLPSANFWLQSVGSKDRLYNFADCGEQRDSNGNLILAWFAAQLSDQLYYEKDRFMMNPEDMDELDREAGFGLIWLSMVNPKQSSTLAPVWQGDGENPVVFFRNKSGDETQFYFGGKGGRGSVNHGNMDAGSFIFELDSIRWSVDLGKQPYHEIEQTGFDLWSSCQTCDRWKLLTKNNFGHSTITINDQLHFADGMATFKSVDKSIPAATINLNEVFVELVDSASRTFIKENEALLVVDSIFTNNNTREITWQMMTVADVAITDDGAVLTQQGKNLKIYNISHPEIQLSVVDLNSPPHPLDKEIPGLKRIELNILVDNKQELQRIEMKLSKK